MVFCHPNREDQHDQEHHAGLEDTIPLPEIGGSPPLSELYERVDCGA